MLSPSLRACGLDGDPIAIRRLAVSKKRNQQRLRRANIRTGIAGCGVSKRRFDRMLQTTES
jgi:hypothetical protein